jgi:hypothetical protein
VQVVQVVAELVETSTTAMVLGVLAKPTPEAEAEPAAAASLAGMVAVALSLLLIQITT